MKKRIILLALAFSTTLYAVKVPFRHEPGKEPHIEAPWFTGPLLAASAVAIPVGHYNIEPYIFATANTGAYNHNWKQVDKKTSWNNYLQTLIEVGITSWIDFQMSPTVDWNYNYPAGCWALGDMPVGFDFQLFKFDPENITDWFTALKFTIKETFPIGKYQNLNPKKRGTDMGGQGSWQTAFALVWGNLFHLMRNHFISWRTSFQYTLPAPVHVKNLNAYGGAKGTKGTVYPAQNFSIDTAVEISFTRNWAFAMDFVGSWSGKTRFKGKATAPNTSPASAQFSLAPAIEYNWSADIGIIFGPWFTIAGRNTPQFTSAVFAFNYYH